MSSCLTRPGPRIQEMPYLLLHRHWAGVIRFSSLAHLECVEGLGLGAQALTQGYTQAFGPMFGPMFASDPGPDQFIKLCQRAANPLFLASVRR